MEQTKENHDIVSLKQHIVTIARKHKLGHIPSCFSCLDIMYVLFSKIANITKNNINETLRDKVIISKEHCKMGLLCVLEKFGLIPKGAADEWFFDGSAVGHDIFKEVSDERYAAVDVAYGSLGMGLGLAAGMALADKNHTIYVIVGDGELQEGSCWEALMFIGHNKIKNVVPIIDRNWIQGGNYTKDTIDSSSHAVEQIASFGFDVIEIDGHDHQKIEEALKQKTNNPKAIVANTIKGKECLFVAKEHGYAYLHNHAYTKEEYDTIIKGIKA